MNFESTIGENTYSVTLNTEDHSFTLNDSSDKYEFVEQNGRYLLRVGTKLYKIDNVGYDGSVITFSINGKWTSVQVKDEQELLLDRLGFKSGDAAGEGILKSPMPGKILDIMIAEGDTVTKGQPLAILEAMKMENELKAPIDGTVVSIQVEAGQSLEKNSPILELE